MAVLAAEVGVVRIPRAVAILDPTECFVQGSCAEVQAEVGFYALFFAFTEDAEIVHELISPFSMNQSFGFG